VTRKYDAAIEGLAEADTLFFEQNPGRRYRFRPAHPSEVSTGLKDRDPVPAGFMVYVVVRQLRPGIRVHALLLGRPGADEPDASEAEAREIFEMATTPESERSTIH
jgi:hypothetical protein